MLDLQAGREASREVGLSAGEGVRHRGHREHGARPEGAYGRGQHEGGVRAPREGDEDAAMTGEPIEEPAGRPVEPGLGKRLGHGESLSPIPGFVDLGFARLDTDRAARTGDPEVVFGKGKRPEHVVALLTRLAYE